MGCILLDACGSIAIVVLIDPLIAVVIFVLILRKAFQNWKMAEASDIVASSECVTWKASVIWVEEVIGQEY